MIAGSFPAPVPPRLTRRRKLINIRHFDIARTTSDGLRVRESSFLHAVNRVGPSDEERAQLISGGRRRPGLRLSCRTPYLHFG